MSSSRRNRSFNVVIFSFAGAAFVYVLVFTNIRIPSNDKDALVGARADRNSQENEDLPSLAKHPPPLWQKFLCDLRNVSLERVSTLAVPLEMISSEDAVQPNQDNIFLMETSCNPLPSYREWCSVESWALQNPTGHVWYIMTSPYIEDPIGLVNKLLMTYKNLIVTTFNFDEIFKKTPLREFFASMKWAKDTDWPAVHVSDMARVALVWAYGGFYSDTDAISLASTSDLYDVLGGLEGGMEYASGQFHFRPKHSFLFEVMQDMLQNFDPKFWGSLGPDTFRRVLEKLCGPRRTTPRDKVFLSCANMTLLPPMYFTPVHYKNIRKAFRPGGGKFFEKVFQNAYSIHFFRHLTSNRTVNVYDKSVYDVAAKKYCPVTYRFISSAETGVF